MLSNKRHILITGVGSGLGKQCLQFFKGIGLARKTTWEEIQKPALEKPYDAIIHSAFNTQQNINNLNLYAYLKDNLLLTQRLTQIPHKKFIFISSIDVYPKTLDHLHSEDDPIPLPEIKSFYGIAKLISESIIQNETENKLILRPTALLGPYAKKNSLIRILTEKNVRLSLAGTSTFNYVLHSDICQIIEHAIINDLQGIYNVATASNVSLNVIAKIFNPLASFGDYVYSTGQIANSKATSIFSDLTRSSLDSVHLFLQTVNFASLISQREF